MWSEANDMNHWVLRSIEAAGASMYSTGDSSFSAVLASKPEILHDHLISVIEDGGRHLVDIRSAKSNDAVLFQWMHFKVVKIEKRKILQFFALNNTITIGVVSLKLLESITKPSTPCRRGGVRR